MERLIKTSTLVALDHDGLWWFVSGVHVGCSWMFFLLFQLLQPDPSQLLHPKTPGLDGGSALQPPSQLLAHTSSYTS